MAHAIVKAREPRARSKIYAQRDPVWKPFLTATWNPAAPHYGFQDIENGLSKEEQKENLRDLGIQLSSDLSFSIHIDKVVTTASQMVGWGFRTFRGSTVLWIKPSSTKDLRSCWSSWRFASGDKSITNIPNYFISVLCSPKSQQVLYISLGCIGKTSSSSLGSNG